MINSIPVLRYLIAGQLSRDYILTSSGKAILDAPGGGVLYSAGGLGLWDNGIGLSSLVGEDYPQEWLTWISKKGIDPRGIIIKPQNIDLRNFIAYDEAENKVTDNPVFHFAKIGQPLPKSLLGYMPPAERPSLPGKRELLHPLVKRITPRLLRYIRSFSLSI